MHTAALHRAPAPGSNWRRTHGSGGRKVWPWDETHIPTPALRPCRWKVGEPRLCMPLGPETRAWGPVDTVTTVITHRLAPRRSLPGTASKPLGPECPAVSTESKATKASSRQQHPGSEVRSQQDAPTRALGVGLACPLRRSCENLKAAARSASRRERDEARLHNIVRRRRMSGPRRRREDRGDWPRGHRPVSGQRPL
ncbi:hypothetical protein VULLAG_LOCUS16951 [Vulpes lagopus]